MSTFIKKSGQVIPKALVGREIKIVDYNGQLKSELGEKILPIAREYAVKHGLTPPKNMKALGSVYAQYGFSRNPNFDVKMSPTVSAQLVEELLGNIKNLEGKGKEPDDEGFQQGSAAVVPTGTKFVKTAVRQTKSTHPNVEKQADDNTELEFVDAENLGNTLNSTENREQSEAQNKMIENTEQQTTSVDPNNAVFANFSDTTTPKVYVDPNTNEIQVQQPIQGQINKNLGDIVRFLSNTEDGKLQAKQKEEYIIEALKKINEWHEEWNPRLTQNSEEAMLKEYNSRLQPKDYLKASDYRYIKFLKSQKESIGALNSETYASKDQWFALMKEQVKMPEAKFSVIDSGPFKTVEELHKYKKSINPKKYNQSVDNTNN